MSDTRSRTVFGIFTCCRFFSTSVDAAVSSATLDSGCRDAKGASVDFTSHLTWWSRLLALEIVPSLDGLQIERDCMSCNMGLVYKQTTLPSGLGCCHGTLCLEDSLAGTMSCGMWRGPPASNRDQRGLSVASNEAWTRRHAPVPKT